MPAAWAAEVDFTDIPLEDLVNVRVIRTPKFAINTDFTPSSISILTRDDIRAYGWRTLGDALRTLNGYSVSNDHTYSYVGVRGISAPGDYRSRLQLLIDGIPTNENIFGSAYFDSSLPIDLDLVEHIEVVRGPSASVFGGDSMFGIINLVTRNGGSIQGTEVSASRGSGRATEGRVTWGRLTENGTDVLLSYTGAYASGGRVNFPEMANGGLDTGGQRVEGEQAGKFYARVKSDGWRATFIHSVRDRSVPTGSYGTEFNDSNHREADIFTLAEVANDHKFSRDLSLHTRVYAGNYLYRGDFPYNYAPPYVLNQDRDGGQWWGFESRLLSTAWQGHRWIAGIEYKANMHQRMRNIDQGYGCFDTATGTGTGVPCMDDRRQSRQASLYAQDEIALGDATYLTVGLRFDKMTDMTSHWSPRLGLVHQNDSGGIFKALLATSFSDPTVYQRFYLTPGYSVGNPNVESERMQSLDLTWEQRLGHNSKLTTTLYYFRVRDLLGTDPNTGLFTNLPDVTGRGLEVEFQHRWQNRASLRLGYTLQVPSIAAGGLENAPRHAAQANLTLPLFGNDWLAGLEGQLVSRRRTATDWVAGHGLANANLIYQPVGQKWDVALGVYNLFDHKYEDPVGVDTTLGGVRDRMFQFGRTFRLKFTARF